MQSRKSVALTLQPDLKLVQTVATVSLNGKKRKTMRPLGHMGNISVEILRGLQIKNKCIWKGVLRFCGGKNDWRWFEKVSAQH